MGAKLISANPLKALNLPLKIRIWEGNYRKVWVAFSETECLVEHYHLSMVLASSLKWNP
ncbi:MULTISPECIES: hypothetical protein [unclassified Mucilaginibacter]|uniref:hypothetical protein n=1 Tax=unclassified Mucilaginibacter TaxID=2617802 RepID=UPI00339B8099